MPTPTKKQAPNKQTPAQWALYISAPWNAARERVIEVGQRLLEAKAALEHGEFIKIIEAELPFKRHTANELMRIAADERLSNGEHAHHLPASWGTLHELTKLDDETFTEALDKGEISPDMGRGDVKRIRDQRERERQAAELDAAREDLGADVMIGDIKQSLEVLAADGRTFKVVLADPAWLYETWSQKGADRSPHYDLMTLEEILALPLEPVLADDAVLFLWGCDWAVTPCEVSPVKFGFTFADPIPVPSVALVAAAWGFKLKTKAFCWIKQTADGEGYHVGQGKWTRANPEDCWLATRGAPKRLAGGGSVRELVVSPIGPHSEKPAAVHAAIERLVAGPYLELFARRPREGWTVLGNQIQGGGNV